MAKEGRKDVSQESENRSIPDTAKQSYASLLERLETCIEQGVERSREADETYLRAVRDAEGAMHNRAKEKVADLRKEAPKDVPLAQSLESELRAAERDAEKSEKDAAKQRRDAMESIRTEAAEGIRQAFRQYVSDVTTMLGAADAAQLDTESVAVVGSLLVDAATKTHRLLNT